MTPRGAKARHETRLSLFFFGLGRGSARGFSSSNLNKDANVSQMSNSMVKRGRLEEAHADRSSDPEEKSKFFGG